MTKLRRNQCGFLPLAMRVAFACLVLSGFACGQTYPSLHEVRVDGLPSLVTRTHDLSDVLLTSLDVILHDREICCGKDSAIGDSSLQADPKSLKDVATRLQGRHLLSDGRPVTITADYIEPDKLSSGQLIPALRDKYALLMEWNSRVYVLYGATYRLDYDADTGGELYTVLTLLLVDTRYTDSRREVVFNRETDDWGKVQGFLYLEAKRQ